MKLFLNFRRFTPRKHNTREQSRCFIGLWRRRKSFVSGQKLNGTFGCVHAVLPVIKTVQGIDKTCYHFIIFLFSF